jgi:hypothetical protein
MDKGPAKFTSNPAKIKQKKEGKLSFFANFFSKNEWEYVRWLFLRLFMILIIYFLLRALFILVHWSAFQTYYFEVTTENVHWIFLAGLEFDFVVILFINLPVIFMHLFPDSNCCRI